MNLFHVITQYIKRLKIWWAYRDLNSDGFPHWNLNPARLPISPYAQFQKSCWITSSASTNLFAFRNCRCCSPLVSARLRFRLPCLLVCAICPVSKNLAGLHPARLPICSLFATVVAAHHSLALGFAFACLAYSYAPYAR